jgi:hypothetical protein
VLPDGRGLNGKKLRGELSMRNILALSALAAGAAMGLRETPASAEHIRFEVPRAPCVFSETTPLIAYYSSRGVTFSGIGGKPGSILNECGNFGIDARSGVDFLAFNTSRTTGDEITFAEAESLFAISVGDGRSATYTATAYNSSGDELGSVSVTPHAGKWHRLLLQFDGITTVDLTSSGREWVADNLRFIPQTATPAISISGVPETSTWAMLLLGFAGLGFAGYRSSRKKTAIEV